MFSNFTYEKIKLSSINLDERNPRIVTQVRLRSQEDILQYLFDHEDLGRFVKKIATEGKNLGAERPYVVKTGKLYTVIEGNTRVAAYKVLAGLTPIPKMYVNSIPTISSQLKSSVLEVDCTVAPNRDALLPIMANSHFGMGDKSKWGYLGSRKAVYDEWKLGKKIPELAKAFDRTKGQIQELIIEYELYLQALQFSWSKEEKEVLLNPAVEFNPPVRFLQTSGHKNKIGIAYDMTNLAVKFGNAEAKKKFRYLIDRLVVRPARNLGATASYDEVFKDFNPAPKSKSKALSTSSASASSAKSTTAAATTGSSSPSAGGAAAPASNLKTGTLFAYQVTVSNLLIEQLMKESKELNCNKFPAAGTFLLRNVIEALLKHIIDQQKANAASKPLDLEGAINLCLSNAVAMGIADKKVLKEFHKQHLSYLNLGAHGNLIPNATRVFDVRDCIDQFVKKYV